LEKCRINKWEISYDWFLSFDNKLRFFWVDNTWFYLKYKYIQVLKKINLSFKTNSPFKKKIFNISKKKQLSNSDFDKNGLDSYGIHWLQYAAFAVSGFAIFTTWAFFYDERFHNFVMNNFRFINCSGFNCNGAF